MVQRQYREGSIERIVTKRQTICGRLNGWSRDSRTLPNHFRGWLCGDDEAMRLALRFLLRQQWDEVSCFACVRDQHVLGGFAEHLASPHIRIDYVQHAWAALGHGGRELGLVPEV